jgi:pimeloyl-ACP methyl ester carboxylesterase
LLHRFGTFLLDVTFFDSIEIITKGSVLTELKTSSGNVLSYHDSGLGPAILFLHSFGHNKNMWYPQLTHFVERGYRVIAPDMPGHGDSSFDADHHTVDHFARLYAELLDELEIRSAIVAGISIGGYVALRMWDQRSDLISALVLICSKAEADTEEIKQRRRAQMANIREKGLESFVLSGAPKRVSQATVENRAWVVDWIKMMNFTVSAEANAATLNAMILRQDDTRVLPSIDVPALILSGGDDVFIPKESPRNLAKGIAGSVHHAVENVGHVASLENPSAVNRYIQEFLTTVQPPSFSR